MGASDYLGLVRGLPRPTWEQTFRFARFVAGSHSWYKHLPLDRKVPFSFYLDPHVGESLVIKPTGERALFEITDESTRWHYAWQTTATFRRRFGRWNDFITYGRPFDVASDGRAVSTERRGPEVMGEDGAWLRVTPGVIEAGAAQINAFVHPGAWYAHQWDLGRVEAAVKHWLSPSPPDIQGDLEPADGRFSAMIEERLRRMIPEADSPVCWEWRGYDWMDEDWEPDLWAAGASDSDLVSIFAAVQRELIRHLLRTSTVERVPDRLMMAMALEMDLQITEMWRAMLRVAASIHGDQVG